MRRSLFTRYITVFMLIIFISFTILALVICSNITAITLDEKREDVDAAAQNISGMITEMYQVQSPDHFSDKFGSSESNFSGYVKHLSDMNDDVRVYLFNINGGLLISGESYESTTFKNTTIPSSVLSEIARNDGYDGYDDMGGNLSGKFLYSIKPVYQKTNDGTSAQAVGYVFVCSAAKGLNMIIGSTVKTILLASLWVFLAALVGVYFLSERIIGPLKSMSRAAKSYAAGNFDIRIPVHGTDEVAELSASFNQMATELQNFENMRRSFLANVSHDLKTPMTTIAGFIDAIISGAIPPEQQHEYLERIKEEILRLSRLVRQLLDISRIQAGDRKLEPVTFDICEVARQIVLSFEQRIEEKKLDVEFNCEYERMNVVADKDAIHQILYNICDNAVKFSHEGGKYKVDITEKDKKVHVSVYNEGQGIAKDDLPFVFERFYKSDKSRGLDKSGVGLGLYIAKTIIDAHRETITVDSVQGEYCVFEFTLSCAESKKPLIEKTARKD